MTPADAVFTRSISFAIVLLLVGDTPVARAQNQLGGHFGVALPLVTHGDGETSTISDDFVIVFPMGITVRRSDRFAFDLELAPIVQNEPRHIDLLIHPGVAWGIGNGYSVGGRLAFVAGTPTWGFTALFNRGLVQLARNTTFFGEIDIPVRFQQDASGIGFTIGRACRRVRCWVLTVHANLE